MHVIDETSPFYGMDAEAMKKAEVELEIAIMGFDDVTVQTVHAMWQYADRDILHDTRFADTLTLLDNGDMLLDVTKFDDTIPET
jgi:inward rectifier potassium channel